jgi:hypothetical protein
MIVIDFEPQAPRMPETRFKEPYAFDESLRRAWSAGYERHPRPAELLGLLVRQLEHRLHPEQAVLARDAQDGDEWLSLGLLSARGRLVLVDDPAGLFLQEGLGTYDFHEDQFRFSRRTVYDLRRLHPENVVPATNEAGKVVSRYVPVRELARAEPGLVERLWSRPYEALPATIQERAVLELPEEGVLTPMQFAHLGYAIDDGGPVQGFLYSICCGAKSGSRGVREVQ